MSIKRVLRTSVKSSITIGLAALPIILFDPPLAFAVMDQDQAMQLSITVSVGHDADAEAFLRQAAQSGDPWAEVGLGSAINMRGALENQPKKYASQALELFKAAAKAGLPAGAMSIGQMYFDGTGIPKNTAQAAYWFKTAAEGYIEQIDQWRNASNQKTQQSQQAQQQAGMHTPQEVLQLIRQRHPDISPRAVDMFMQDYTNKYQQNLQIQLMQQQLNAGGVANHE